MAWASQKPLAMARNGEQICRGEWIVSMVILLAICMKIYFIWVIAINNLINNTHVSSWNISGGNVYYWTMTGLAGEID